MNFGFLGSPDFLITPLKDLLSPKKMLGAVQRKAKGRFYSATGEGTFLLFGVIIVVVVVVVARWL